MRPCAICGTDPKDDLFSYVTDEPVCSICKVLFVGGLPTTLERIAEIRRALGLEEGKFVTLDRAALARRILGH